MDVSKANAQVIEQEIAWFERVLDTRIRLYFEQDCDAAAIQDVVQPAIVDDCSEYGHLLRSRELSFDARLLLILALLPYVRPQALDTFYVQNKSFDRSFTEFGGRRGKSHSGFLPTAETAMFLLAGTDLERRFECLSLFDRDHPFFRDDILRIDYDSNREPTLSGALSVSPEWLSRITSGITHKPDFSGNFPAKLITTRYSWDDLVLPVASRQEIDNIVAWAKSSKRIMRDWGFDKYFKPGFRSLFYGPPGTGKTLTASLIGQAVGADVYRIDLSMVVSKYVGETEKNLAGVFDQAANKNWILFFDEADALFGRRTQAGSANDRYANQEVSYLLQRVEDFPGIVLLASNLRSNIDEAFLRRFQNVVHFPVPDVDQRDQLWRQMLRSDCLLEEGLDTSSLAATFELTGGAINNAVRYAAVKAADGGQAMIRMSDLQRGALKELEKEGRTS